MTTHDRTHDRTHDDNLLLSESDQVARLAAENIKLKKINAALMSRVERAINQPTNPYYHFEMAVALEKSVQQRVQEQQTVLRAI